MCLWNKFDLVLSLSLKYSQENILTLLGTLDFQIHLSWKSCTLGAYEPTVILTFTSNEPAVKVHQLLLIEITNRQWCSRSDGLLYDSVKSHLEFISFLIDRNRNFGKKRTSITSLNRSPTLFRISR
jgi:hypothetical protein